MYCRFKCDNCGEWHPLEQFTNDQLRAFAKLVLIHPFEPFTREEWVKILLAEFKKRGM